MPSVDPDLMARNQELLLNIGKLRSENAELKEQVRCLSCSSAEGAYSQVCVQAERSNPADLEGTISELRGELRRRSASVTTDTVTEDLRAQNLKLLATVVSMDRLAVKTCKLTPRVMQVGELRDKLAFVENGGNPLDYHREN